MVVFHVSTFILQLQEYPGDFPFIYRRIPETVWSPVFPGSLISDRQDRIPKARPYGNTALRRRSVGPAAGCGLPPA